MLYLKLAWSYVRALYRMEPAMINASIASLIVVGANRYLGLELDTVEVLGIVALILGGGFKTRGQVTAPANVIPADLDLGDAGTAHVEKGKSDG